MPQVPAAPDRMAAWARANARALAAPRRGYDSPHRLAAAAYHTAGVLVDHGSLHQRRLVSWIRVVTRCEVEDVYYRDGGDNDTRDQHPIGDPIYPSLIVVRHA